ncbi:unnamed protein product [Lathyrus sativus]|nr:unnamed protein product [Lathyrus sativus]
MASTKHLLLVLCLGVCVGMCRSWVEDVAEENPESFSHWALNAVSQVLESENDDATQNMKLKAEDAASRATETMKSVASGASEYSSQKATNAKEAIGSDDIIRMPIDKVTEAKDTVQDTYENAKQKLSSASDKASNIAHDVYNVKNDIRGEMDCGGNDNNAFGVYDEAKDEVSKAYISAKNSMGEEAKAKYEAAKEKASEATGNLGAKMRNTPLL